MINLPHHRNRIRGQAGFSMVEISLALLVVALGLMIVMGLLPAGLSEVESAVENTRTAMWADDLFNRFQANALLAQTQDEFEDGSVIFEGFTEGGLNTATIGGGKVRWKYFNELNQAVPSTPVWRVRVEVRSGADGPFMSSVVKPKVFYTELVYGAVSP